MKMWSILEGLAIGSCAVALVLATADAAFAKGSSSTGVSQANSVVIFAAGAEAEAQRKERAAAVSHGEHVQSGGVIVPYVILIALIGLVAAGFNKESSILKVSFVISGAVALLLAMLFATADAAEPEAEPLFPGLLICAPFPTGMPAAQQPCVIIIPSSRMGYTVDSVEACGPANALLRGHPGLVRWLMSIFGPQVFMALKVDDLCLPANEMRALVTEQGFRIGDRQWLLTVGIGQGA